MAVLAFMATAPGKMLFSVSILNIHPASAARPIKNTAALKNFAVILNFFSIWFMFGCTKSALKNNYDFPGF